MSYHTNGTAVCFGPGTNKHSDTTFEPNTVERLCNHRGTLWSICPLLVLKNSILKCNMSLFVSFCSCKMCRRGDMQRLIWSMCSHSQPISYCSLVRSLQGALWNFCVVLENGCVNRLHFKTIVRYWCSLLVGQRDALKRETRTFSSFGLLKKIQPSPSQRNPQSSSIKHLPRSQACIGNQVKQ